jgi:hypothetical protein
MKTREEVIELVRRCLALSKSSNEHEAALAMAKAQQILFEHNLSMSEVQSADEFSKKASGMTQSKVSTQMKRNHGHWKPQLIHWVARYNFCSVILSSYGDTVYLIGQPINVEVVTNMYIWVCDQLENMASEYCKSYQGPDRIPTFRRGFFDGAVNEIGNRLYRNQKEMKAKIESSTALVVQNEEMLKAYIDQKFGELKSGRASRGSGSYDGHRAGRDAGSKVSLTPQKKVSNSVNEYLN